MRALLLLAVAGCNPLFGLEPTQPVDAAVPFDAPPPMCPAIAAGPPLFTQNATVFASMHCVAYTTSVIRGTAVALCDSGLLEGPIGTDAFVPLAITVPAGFTQ